jgi:hypothetical protein
MDLLTLLITAVIIGPGASYSTRLLRELPGFRTLNEREIKPVACNVCMSFWMSVVLLAMATWQDAAWSVEYVLRFAVAVVVSAGVSLWMLENRKPTKDFVLPEG